MSKASDGAPTKRKDVSANVADVGTPVKVDRVEAETLLGVVRERTEYDGYDAPAHVTVEGTKTEVNVSEQQVSVARGANADVVHSLVAGGEDDV